MIHFEVRDHVAVLTMQGETDLNLGVIGPDLFERLLAYQDDSALRCAIITGAGSKAFSAGADLKKAAKEGIKVDFWTGRDNAFMRNTDFRKPLIAAVNGHALGMGMMLALYCDIRIASRNASFGLPEVKYGLSPGLGATQRLPRQIALGPALELLLTGDAIGAEQAECWGLVNRVVESDDLMPAALSLAQRIAKNPPLAVQAARELAWKASSLPIEHGIRAEMMMGEIVRKTEDAVEGVRAFAEKRPPVFKGR
jgi:enoyl-CoA hydratase/carnithine racemase